MKNTATLGQITKILSLLEGIPSEQVQKVLESGYFASVIRTGDLDEERKRADRKSLEQAWRLIGRLTEFKGISITVPHDPCQHRQNEGVVYQLRCWDKGEIGYPKRGHIDQGSAGISCLFEATLPEQLKDCECCWSKLEVRRHHLQTSQEFLIETKGFEHVPISSPSSNSARGFIVYMLDLKLFGYRPKLPARVDFV